MLQGQGKNRKEGKFAEFKNVEIIENVRNVSYSTTLINNLNRYPHTLVFFYMISQSTTNQWNYGLCG